MAPLPADRLTPSPPFTYVGVNTFGPWSIVTRSTRGGKANSKRWAIIFSCLVSRAVHIEVIEDMSSSCFINALRRFVALRGPVKELRSDRGTNFIGATDDLNIAAINVEDKHIYKVLLQHGIIWKFNAPHASHMGGAWERMIGRVRRILDSMLCDVTTKHLTHEVLCSFMAEICAIVNSRPIMPVSNDPDSPTILSPNVLITQKVNNDVQELANISIKDIYKSQWRQVQLLADQFWKQWRSQYLQTLQSRRIWHSEQQNVKAGDVVITMDSAAARNHWPVAVVEDIFPSSDGFIRKVSVRLMIDGKPVSYTRPITEIIYLFSQYF